MAISPSIKDEHVTSSTSVRFEDGAAALKNELSANASSSNDRMEDPYPEGMGSDSAAASGSNTGRGSGTAAIPLSAVHINNALEKSLRKAEEERQRRSLGRRQKRRRRQQSVQVQDTVSTSEGDKALPEVRDSEVEEGGHVSSSGGEAGTYDSAEEDDSSDEDDDDGRSLTRQLAETAISVREMSRELGRAKIKSSIQSVLIVTKARDNQLIKLTREIALYLMKTPRHGKTRGLIVYVDAQLRKSKRFDASGLERDNPEIMRPDRSHHHQGVGGNHRRQSRRTSASLSSINLFGTNSTSSAVATQNIRLSALSSGTSTPAHGSSSHPSSLSNGKPLTKLTEALVSRQLDKHLENEQVKRSISLARLAKESDGNVVATNANTSTGNGEDQMGLLRYWTAEMCSKNPHLFDLVVTVNKICMVLYASLTIMYHYQLGGDGTVLFTSWLFQHVVPPVIPFALGSLGFLTNFDFSDCKRVMDSAINDGVRVNLRMRFTATIYRAVEDEVEQRRRVVRSGETGQILREKLRSGGWDAIEAAGQAGGKHLAGRDRDLTCTVTRPAESFEVLNDLVVDRGPSPYVSLLELFGRTAPL